MVKIFEEKIFTIKQLMQRNPYITGFFVCLMAATFFYIKESIGIPPVDPLAYVVMGELFPDNFKNDPTWSNPPPYTPVHELVLTFLWSNPGTFITKYKIVLFCIILFTGYFIFLLFYKISEEFFLSLGMTVCLLLCNIRDALFEVDTGFSGITNVMARFEGGVFLPLIVLGYLKWFKSKNLPIIFFFVGILTAVYPAMYNTTCLLFIIYFIYKQCKCNVKKSLKTTVVSCLLAFILGCMPLVFFTLKQNISHRLRFSIEGGIGPFEDPWSAVFNHIIFPPLVALIGLLLVLVFLKNKNQNQEIKDENYTNVTSLIFIGYAISTLLLPIISWFVHRWPVFLTLAMGTLITKMFFVIYLLIFLGILLGLKELKKGKLFSRKQEVLIYLLVFFGLISGFHNFDFLSFQKIGAPVSDKLCSSLNIAYKIGYATLVYFSVLYVAYRWKKNFQKLKIGVIIIIYIVAIPNFLLMIANLRPPMINKYNLFWTHTIKSEALYRDMIKYVKNNIPVESKILVDPDCNNITFKALSQRSTTATIKDFEFVSRREDKEKLTNEIQNVKIAMQSNKDDLIKFAKELKADYIVLKRDIVPFYLDVYETIFENKDYKILRTNDFLQKSLSLP